MAGEDDFVRMKRCLVVLIECGFMKRKFTYITMDAPGVSIELMKSSRQITERYSRILNRARYIFSCTETIRIPDGSPENASAYLFGCHLTLVTECMVFIVWT